MRQGKCQRWRMRIEIEREDDGRWIAEIPDLPGVMVYGKSREEAIVEVEALALRVPADHLNHGEGSAHSAVQSKMIQWTSGGETSAESLYCAHQEKG